MKKMMILFFIACQACFAGDNKGNGADGILCSDQGHLLDLYESGFVSPVSNVTDEKLLLKKMLNDTDSLWENRNINFTAWIDSFYEEADFVKNSELGEIADAGDIKINIPNGCKLVQLVLQKHIVFGNEKRYLVNYDLWNKLDIFNKAATVFHEVLYRELNSQNSSRIRSFNSYFFKSYFSNQITLENMISEFKKLNVPYFYYYHLPLDVKYITIIDNKLYAKKSIGNLPFNIFENTVMSTEQFIDSYSTGMPIFFNFFGKLSLKKQNYEISYNDSEMNRVSFYPTGKIKSILKVDVMDISTNVVKKGATVFFNEEGDVLEIH